MLVRPPGGAAGAVRDDLVCLTDVTATLLAASGHGVPEYMDARPLPGLGLPAILRATCSSAACNPVGWPTTGVTSW